MTSRLNAVNDFIVTALTVTICLVCFISHGPSDTVTVATSSATAGSCASIGYSTKCCPPEGNCTVTAKSTSGSPSSCRCNVLCHNPSVNDCCTDIFCPKEPRTCHDIGCCNDEDHNAAPGCNSYYKLNGTWQLCNLPSSCQPRAVSISCRLPSIPLHDILSVRTTNVDGRQQQSIVILQCQKGYVPDEPLTTICNHGSDDWYPNPFDHYCSADIDECLEDLHNCSQHAVCINIDGSYTCECVFGFEGNGVNCTLSRSVIIGTGIAGSLLVGAVLLLVTIVGCIKIIKSRIPKKKDDHEMIVITNGTRQREDSNSESINAMKTVALRGSLKEKLTLSFIKKSINLKILNPIGQGESGIVYKGYIVHKYTDELVAIKTLKGFIDENTVEELLRECDKMKNFFHQHVMTLKGVCLDGGPAPYLILPYMANGSLLSYIKKERSTLVVMDEDDTDSNENLSQIYFMRKRLLDMCLQVAKGMEYLASEKVVHRDLAARNCMIDINMVIKVADFGLAVNTGDKDYYRLTTNMGVKLPVMWMAPESLSNRVFSEMSDVWSYGVTCWEIFTGGQTPYAGTKPSSLFSLLQEGERLETPKNSACNSDMYSMMLWCWEMEPGKRPSFSALVQTLSKTLEEMADYLHVGAFTDLESSTEV